MKSFLKTMAICFGLVVFAGSALANGDDGDKVPIPTLRDTACFGADYSAYEALRDAYVVSVEATKEQRIVNGALGEDVSKMCLDELIQRSAAELGINSIHVTVVPKGLMPGDGVVRDELKPYFDGAFPEVFWDKKGDKWPMKKGSAEPTGIGLDTLTTADKIPPYTL